jgi:iron complex transport system ATP-binding protein
VSEGDPARPVDGAPLRTEDLSLGYDSVLVVEALDLSIPARRLTALVGPNACGKSTLLRGMARLLRPRGGAVYLDGQAIARYRTRDVARRLGLLPQAPAAPDGLTVEGLVARGRYPHQRWFQQWSQADETAVERAMELTGVVELRDHAVDALSGGQRQRAWIAMALAQETAIMLLDEPTTYLDLAHQVEILDLLHELNESEGRTIVMVLHDLNQAARYADHMVAMHAGKVVAEGRPDAVVTRELVREVFGVDCRILADPETGSPLVIPRSRAGRAATRAIAS